MNRPRTFSACLIVTIALVACNLPSAGSPTMPLLPPQLTQTAIVATEPPSSPTATAAVPTVPPLTAEMLKNGTYKLPQSGETVTLVGGKYDRDTPHTNVLHVVLLDSIAFGDLNGDGTADAAILLAENTGGSGDFISAVIMLNQAGAPLQSASRYIDDRARINGMTYLNGRLVLDAVIHGVGDPLCCPNFPVVETLQLRDNQLVLSHFTSTPPGGSLREIVITAPAAGGSVSGSVTVAGSVTIAPFENTLNDSIFDLGGNLLGSGPIPVASAGMGTPGTFGSPVDLSTIPAGAVIRIEIRDLSAADGSILAMDSVEVVVK